MNVRCASNVMALAFLGLFSCASASSSESIRFGTKTVAGTSAHASVTLSAELHLPTASKGPVAAMVIISSSGGVLRYREEFYARRLQEAGIAALVVDSFGPRGVQATFEDQSKVTVFQMELDAFASLERLAADPRIDPKRIGIMGVSKGGIVSLNAAMAVRESWRGLSTHRFAAHVPIVPSCMEQQRTTRTSGAPMLWMLAEKDDYTPVAECLFYAERLREQGARLQVIVYPGANHGWESPSLQWLPTAERSRCPTLIEDNGSYTVIESGVNLRGVQIRRYLETHCLARGAHAGGGSSALKERATRDLVAFLRRVGF